MKVLVCLALHAAYVTGVIRDSALVNKLVNVKPVGPTAVKKFVPLTEIPPPHPIHHRHKAGRRHFEDCSPKPDVKEVIEGVTVDIFGEYYDDHMSKTVATVIIPDHIDRKHFEVTTQVPYLTVGNIEAIGFHPTYPAPLSDCEKIYQDHMNEQYSEAESEDHSEESLEMARMPVGGVALDKSRMEIYDDLGDGTLLI